MPSGIYKRTKQHGENLSKSLKGRKVWNEGMKGIYKTHPCSEITKVKISQALKGHKTSDITKEKIRAGNIGKQVGENNASWVGNEIKYHGVHSWVGRWKGKPEKCEICGNTKAKKYEWANIDHTYRRVLDDYIRVCTSCHRKYDYKHNLKPNNKIGNNQFKKL